MLSKTDGRDYHKSFGNITFAPREQQNVIRVPIIDDTQLEMKEEFFFIEFNVSPTIPGLLIRTSMVIVTIMDDDCELLGVT